jgi:hypothetical protein
MHRTLIVAAIAMLGIATPSAWRGLHWRKAIRIA